MRPHEITTSCIGALAVYFLCVKPPMAKARNIFAGFKETMMDDLRFGFLGVNLNQFSISIITSILEKLWILFYIDELWSY